MHRRRDAQAHWERSLPPRSRTDWAWPMLLTLGFAAAVFLAVVQWLAWRDARTVTPPQSGRAASAARPEAAAPAAPAPPQTETGTGTGTGVRVRQVTQCVARDGSTSYVDGPCAAGTRSRIVRVLPDANLADGLSAQARAASLRDNAQVALEVQAHERRVALNVDTPSLECPWWDERIKALDALARQGQSAASQDRLRQDRKEVRDRQFALRC